jgi:hypothetical protein
MKHKNHNSAKKLNVIPINYKLLSEKSLRSLPLPEFYKDETYKCVDCSKISIFSAQEQQNWYEVQKKYFWQRPVRCLLHHDIWRDTRKRKFTMDQKLEELRENPENRKTMIASAEAIVQFHKKTKTGNLELAISLFKKLKIETKYYLYCKENLSNS